MRDMPAGRPDTHRVTLTLLTPGDSPRLNGEDENHVKVLAQSETVLPPILVHRNNMRIIDGIHRWRAAQALGRGTIEVEFFDGDEADAFIAAVRANIGHGLPLSRADREAAVARILRSRPATSDRWIAEIAGLAAGTVGAIRRRLAGGDQEESLRVGRDGRIRPIDAVRGRQNALDALKRHPLAPVREIARIAGVSPSTAHDVRRRLSRGEDPVHLRGRSRQAADEDRGDRSQGPERDLAAVLHGLSTDPSLRFTDVGRSLLRFLFARAVGPRGGEGLIEGIPTHCVLLVAELAEACAMEWQEFANVLKHHTRSTA